MGKGEIDKKVKESIRKSNHEFITKELVDFLKIPSNTLNPKGIDKAKNFLKAYINDFCEDIREIEGQINPLILARVEGHIKDPLLIYMMYDTQPITNENDWISKPFSAETRILPEPLDKLGNCIIARGSYNSKTPLLSFLNVIKILKNADQLSHSLLLLFDGEEEIGSPSLLRILENKRNLFKSCVDAYYPAAKQDLNGKAILKLGYKGILSLTIKILSSNEETHSAYSSMIPNPALTLTNLLTSIYSEHKFNSTLLKEPYKLSDQEKELLNVLFNRVDLPSIKEKAGINQTLKDNIKESFRDYLFNPTFNISKLKSGYLEKGIKNIVPNNAECNIDIRFAHNISIADLYSQIKTVVENYRINSKLDIELTKNIAYEGSRVNKDSILVKSLIKSFEELNIENEIWPISAAAAPLSKIQKELGLNFVVGGLGIGGFAHSPNEFIQLESILKMRLCHYDFLSSYSALVN